MKFRIDKHHQVHIITEAQNPALESDITLSVNDTISLARLLYATACLDIAEEMKPVTKKDKEVFVKRLVESMLEG